ncbi:hypothetical protein GCM10023086_29110 [Streptomyces venetus]|uniref:Uncharacterized protein n=1 Tax=Streptomyces venetus TaxID=1701086 RepID=A0ABP8FRN6_9ACTN
MRTTEFTTIAKSSSATVADSRRPTRRRGTIRGRSSAAPDLGSEAWPEVFAPPVDGAGAGLWSDAVRSEGEAIRALQGREAWRGYGA